MREPDRIFPLTQTIAISDLVDDSYLDPDAKFVKVPEYSRDVKVVWRGKTYDAQTLIEILLDRIKILEDRI